MNRRCPKCKGTNTEEYAQTRTVEDGEPDPWRCLDCETFFHENAVERPADVDDEEWAAMEAEAASLSKGTYLYFWGWLDQLVQIRGVLGHWPVIIEGAFVRWRPIAEGGPRRTE